MEIGQSVLLVKPDGLAHPQKLAAIYAQIERENLHVLHELNLVLPPEVIHDIWPKFADAEHAFASAMLQSYLSGSPVRAIFVSGGSNESTIECCRRVRKQIREMFGTSMFANSVHTPADEVEREGNLRFFDAWSRGVPHKRHRDDSAGAGRFGRFAELGDEALAYIVDTIWRRTVSSGGWDWLRTDPPSNSSFVWLRPGSDNSVDREVAVLCEEFGHRCVEWCMNRFLEAEMFDRAPAPIDPGRTVCEVAQALREQGVRIEIGGPGRGADVASDDG